MLLNDWNKLTDTQRWEYVWQRPQDFILVLAVDYTGVVPAAYRPLTDGPLHHSSNCLVFDDTLTKMHDVVLQSMNIAGLVVIRV